MSPRWMPYLTVMFALLTTVSGGIGLYVGLRLEPLYNKMAELEVEFNGHEANSRAVINDYIAFKAQTIEIMRQQNEELDEVKVELKRIRASR